MVYGALVQWDYALRRANPHGPTLGRNQLWRVQDGSSHRKCAGGVQRCIEISQVEKRSSQQRASMGDKQKLTCLFRLVTTTASVTSAPMASTTVATAAVAVASSATMSTLAAVAAVVGVRGIGVRTRI